MSRVGMSPCSPSSTTFIVVSIEEDCRSSCFVVCCYKGVGRGGWGVPGVGHRALQSTDGHLLEKMRTSRLGMWLAGCPE